MKDLPALLLIFLIATLAILGVVGWILNIVALCHMDFSHVTGEMVVRIVGIFVAVIGAVYGWF